MYMYIYYNIPVLCTLYYTLYYTLYVSAYRVYADLALISLTSCTLEKMT